MKWVLYSIPHIMGIVEKRGEGLYCRLRLSLAVLWYTLIMCLCHEGEGGFCTGMYQYVCMRKHGGLTGILDKYMAWYCIVLGYRT